MTVTTRRRRKTAQELEAETREIQLGVDQTAKQLRREETKAIKEAKVQKAVSGAMHSSNGPLPKPRAIDQPRHQQGKGAAPHEAL